MAPHPPARRAWAPGTVGVAAQLAAQAADHGVHVPQASTLLVHSTDPLQQVVVGRYPPGIGRKLDQHPALDGGQRRHMPCQRTARDSPVLDGPETSL